MKVAIATAMMIEFGINHRQRFLVKIKRIMFDIETK
jgi:hypothetical protein